MTEEGVSPEQDIMSWEGLLTKGQIVWRNMGIANLQSKLGSNQHFLGIRTICKISYAFIRSITKQLMKFVVYRVTRLLATEYPLQYYMVLYSIYNPLIHLGIQYGFL